MFSDRFTLKYLFSFDFFFENLLQNAIHEKRGVNDSFKISYNLTSKMIVANQLNVRDTNMAETM